ncbi:hypothetical protein B7486_60005, partial [cyanobacterium TDX16]
TMRSSADRRWPWRWWGAVDGLPGDVVTALASDGRGLLWGCFKDVASIGRSRGAVRLMASGLIVLAGVLAVGGCSEGDSGTTSDERNASELGIQWAGFDESQDVELVGYEQQEGMDTIVMFALQGDASAISEVLADAGFTAAFAAGIGTAQPPIDGVDLAMLQAPETAEDSWTDAHGVPIHRQVVRGSIGEGEEVIHVWAFTT